MMKYAVLNCSSANEDAMARIAYAMDLYLRLVSRAWGLRRIEVQWMPGVQVAPVGWIAATAFDHPDEPNALGYHSKDPMGRPYMKAFLDVIPGCNLLFDPTGHGQSLANVLMHEAAETAIDTSAGLWATGPILDVANNISYELVADEISDPVQDRSFPIPLPDGSKVDGANFILPPWFIAESKGEQYDYLNVLKAPLTLDAGGYAIGCKVGPDGQLFAQRIEHHETPPALWRNISSKHESARAVRRRVR